MAWLVFSATDGGKYAQELMRNCEKLARNSQGAGLTDIKKVLQQIAATTESSGSARVLIAHFAHQVASEAILLSSVLKKCIKSFI